MRFKHRGRSKTKTDALASKIQDTYNHYRSTHSEEEVEFELRKQVMAFFFYQLMLDEGNDPESSEFLVKTSIHRFCEDKGYTKSSHLPDPKEILEHYGMDAFMQFTLRDEYGVTPSADDILKGKA